MAEESKSSEPVFRVGSVGYLPSELGPRGYLERTYGTPFMSQDLNTIGLLAPLTYPVPSMYRTHNEPSIALPLESVPAAFMARHGRPINEFVQTSLEMVEPRRVTEGERNRQRMAYLRNMQTLKMTGTLYDNIPRPLSSTEGDIAESFKPLTEIEMQRVPVPSKSMMQRGREFPTPFDTEAGYIAIGPAANLTAAQELSLFREVIRERKMDAERNDPNSVLSRYYRELTERVRPPQPPSEETLAKMERARLRKMPQLTDAEIRAARRQVAADLAEASASFGAAYRMNRRTRERRRFMENPEEATRNVRRRFSNLEI